MLQILDCVGAVGPAVGVDHAVGDALAVALDGLPEVLLAGQHRREENEQRQCGLKGLCLNSLAYVIQYTLSTL